MLILWWMSLQCISCWYYNINESSPAIDGASNTILFYLFLHLPCSLLSDRTFQLQIICRKLCSAIFYAIYRKREFQVIGFSRFWFGISESLESARPPSPFVHTHCMLSNRSVAGNTGQYSWLHLNPPGKLSQSLRRVPAFYSYPHSFVNPFPLL